MALAAPMVAHPQERHRLTRFLLCAWALLLFAASATSSVPASASTDLAIAEQCGADARVVRRDPGDRVARVAKLAAVQPAVAPRRKQPQRSGADDKLPRVLAANLAPDVPGAPYESRPTAEKPAGLAEARTWYPRAPPHA